ASCPWPSWSRNGRAKKTATHRQKRTKPASPPTTTTATRSAPPQELTDEAGRIVWAASYYKVWGQTQHLQYLRTGQSKDLGNIKD
ncbi:hypothetical protein CTI10_014300, partial [Delftia acidovorans]